MKTASVKSADRVLMVLEVFAQEKRPLTQKALLDRLNYPQSSTTALLKSLCASGYLNYNISTRSYFPTSRVRLLGGWIDSDIPDNSHIYTIMRQLRDKFGETVAVGVQSDIHLQYLRAIESDFVIRYHIPEGSLRYLTDSSMGWMLLSGLSKAKIETICLRTNSGRSPDQRIDVNDFLRQIEPIRSQEYCFVPDRGIPYPAGTIAMFLPTTFNDQRIAIGLGGVMERIAPRKEEIVAEMKRALVRYQ
jgi:DNA-binding IclR family transcriptional regulator